MWFVIEACGIICAMFTYVTVFTVQFAFIRIGVWEELLSGDVWAYIHLTIFSFNVFMIIASHLKCMTTEPGCLPRDYEELDPTKLPHELSQALAQIQSTLLNDDSEEITQNDTSSTLDSTSISNGSENNLNFVNNLQNQNIKKQKDEDRKTYENILKRVNTNKTVTKGDNEDNQPLNHVIFNARNVRYLDKILSKKCKKCNSIKPPHSHHCSTCKRCVAHMDHHCPWVNNCVGFYTQKHFILFLFYVFNGSLHALYLLCKNSIYCIDKNCAIFQSLFNIVATAIAIFLALLFCLFVCIMFCDQISCIVNNTSTIDKLQKESPDRKSKKTGWQNLEQVFNGGKGFDIWWFIPTDVPRTLNVEKEFE